jgi:hypothetical protein
MKTNELWLSRREFVASASVAMASLWLTPWQLKASETTMLRKTIPGSGCSTAISLITRIRE